MLNYAKIKNRSRIFQSLTGLTPVAFAKLLPAFNRAYQTALLAQDVQRETPRQRRQGGGREATLETMADKLVFILFYFKFYPTQELLGFFFGFSQGQANHWVHRLTPILNQALGYEKQIKIILSILIIIVKRTLDKKKGSAFLSDAFKKV